MHTALRYFGKYPYPAMGSARHRWGARRLQQETRSTAGCGISLDRDSVSNGLFTLSQKSETVSQK